MVSPDEAAAVQTALAESPDIKRLQSLLVAKDLEIKGTESRRLPQIDLVAQYALFANYNNIQQQYFAEHSSTNNGEIGAVIQIPIFFRHEY